MILRIASILFPMFALVGLGYAYGRRHETDMTAANHLNMEIFVPALIFAALASKSFDPATYGGLALAMALMILCCGAIAWLLARIGGHEPLALAPPLMFSNSVNLGVPLAVLTFGSDILPLAIVLFVVSTLLHFSFGVWLLDHQARIGSLWRHPAVLAAFLGFAAGSSGIVLWPPLLTAVKMLGDISIPLALFGLGVRLTEGGLAQWRVGLLGAVARPLAGMLLALGLAWLLRLPPRDASLLFLYGALPPAVMNYVFAERYRRAPEQVASIVLVGNLASIVFLPIALAIVLSR